MSAPIAIGAPRADDLACGAGDCGIAQAHAVEDAGMALLACKKCGVLRIPNEALSADHVDPDPVTELSPVMRTLFSMRMAWLGGEAPALHNKDVRFLDVGCGDGQFLSFLKQRGYSNLTGIEPDPARAANAGKRGLPIFASVEAARAQGAVADSIELMTVWHVLEHVRQPIPFLNKYAPLLAPNGIMLVSVPNQKAAQTRLFGKYSAYPDYGRHIWYHDPSYLGFLQAELPDFHISILRDLNYEYEIFAWVESPISAIVRDPCFVNRTLKKGEGGAARKMITALASAALLPAATIAAPLSINLGAPSTLTFAIRRAPESAR
jgi:SAM-dependent methyltransferase